VYTSLYALCLAVWVLAMLHSWGLSGGPIAPHFAFALLHVYVALYLHVQVRFALPLMGGSLLAFVAILASHVLAPDAADDPDADAGPLADAGGDGGRTRTGVNELVFASCYLAILSGALLYGCWKGESRVRANYLVQYALDMEQLQLDAFLNNLLPRFVVNVLKKQAPGRTDNGANGGSNKAGNEGTGAASAATAKDGFDSLAAGGAVSTPATSRRRSIFDAGVGPGSGTGAPSPAHSLGGAALGLSSRFAMHFPEATIFESDIVGYTKLVSNWPAQRTLRMLNELFSMFDLVAERAGVEKIETIGDAFMCVVFEAAPDAVLDFALDVIRNLRDMNAARCGGGGGEGEGEGEDGEAATEAPIEIRSGVCTGSCYGGVIGSDVPRFHLFGPAHDGSILLEQNGRAMAAMVSGRTAQQAATRFVFERRPEVAAACEDDEAVGEVWQLMGRADGTGPTTAAAATLEGHVVVPVRTGSAPTSPSAAGGGAPVPTSATATVLSPSVSVPKSGGWV
jgi:class 3 adenylate cyclase